MMTNYNQTNIPTGPKKNRRLKIILFTVLAIFILFLVLTVPIFFHGLRAVNITYQAWSKAGELSSCVNNKDWRLCAQLTNALQQDVKSVNGELNNLGLVSKLPKIGNDLYVTRQFLTVAEDLTGSYGETFNLLADASDAGADFDLASLFKNKEALKSISGNQSRLVLIDKNIAKAKSDFSSLNVENFSGFFATYLIKAHSQLAQIIESTDLALPLMPNLSDLLGFEKEKKYLLVFQNNMELRPTGGFIGSYGVITVKDGSIKNIFTDDVYNLDKLSIGKMNRPAPPQMLLYNKQKIWYLRDANWYANWPDSARNIVSFFNEEVKNAGVPAQTLDGVIAITPDFIANLLEVVGPIEVDGVTFSSQNFAMDLEQFVEFDFEHKNIPIEQRKAIIGPLSKILIERVEKQTGNNLLQLWLAFKKNIDQKQILVYMFDPKLQQYFSDKNWAGEIRATDGDYLMVVDSNFASLKTDFVIKRAVRRELKLDASGNLVARVEITYNHTGKAVKDLITRYRVYAKVYVPEGSWFERGWVRHGDEQLVLDVKKDLGYGAEFSKAFADYFVVIEPGDSKTVILEYRLPDRIKEQYKNGDYSLLIQKQPGTPGADLDILLNFDKMIAAYNSAVPPSEFKGKALRWQMDLSMDRSYRVKF